MRLSPIYTETDHVTIVYVIGVACMDACTKIPSIFSPLLPSLVLPFVPSSEAPLHLHIQGPNKDKVDGKNTHIL